MEKNIAQVLEDLSQLVSSWRGDLDKIWHKHSDEVSTSAGSLPPLIKQQLQTMMATIQVSRSTLEAEQLAADIRLRGEPDPSIVQTTIQFIDARIAAADKSRAAMVDLLKTFDQAQQSIKDHATAARSALTPPPSGGSSGGKPPTPAPTSAPPAADTTKRGGIFGGRS